MQTSRVRSFTPHPEIISNKAFARSAKTYGWRRPKCEQTAYFNS